MSGSINNVRWTLITGHFYIITNQLFELIRDIFLEYWHSNFQVCVEVKSENCYSSVSLSAVSLLDIKESILV